MKWLKTPLLLLPIFFIGAAALLAQEAPLDAEAAVNDLLLYGYATASGFISSAILGGIKKIQPIVDSAVWKLIKPIQPIVVAALTMALPIVANALGISDVPTADVFVAAPFGTVIAVTAREVLKKLKGPQEPTFG
jgi:hypothetical protein